jgi:hypothetical protein
MALETLLRVAMRKRRKGKAVAGGMRRGENERLYCNACCISGPHCARFYVRLDDYIHLQSMSYIRG